MSLGIECNCFIVSTDVMYQLLYIFLDCSLEPVLQYFNLSREIMWAVNTFSPQQTSQFLHLVCAAEVVVSNLRRIRIRSNSTGGKHSSPKEAAAPKRFGNQLETPDKQRLPCGGKVPKSASVSALSLIITTGTGGLPEQSHNCY